MAIYHFSAKVISRANGSSAVAAAALSLCIAPAQAQAPSAPAASEADPGNLGGVWIISGYKGSQGNTARQRMLMTIDGKMPPLRPARNPAPSI